MRSELFSLHCSSSNKSRRRVLLAASSTVYVGTTLLDVSPSHQRPNTWEARCACDFSLIDQKAASVQVQRLGGHSG